MALRILSGFPAAFDNPMPPFTSEGSLPLGDYRPLRAEFELRFVNLGDIAQRNLIYEGWNRHRRALLTAGLDPGARQLLNGSYTTDKASPGDIDLAVEVPLADGRALRSLKPDDPVVHLLGGARMKASFKCHAYPIYALPPTDPLHVNVTMKAIEYWTKWFGTARDGIAKGRVWALTGGLA